MIQRIEHHDPRHDPCWLSLWSARGRVYCLPNLLHPAFWTLSWHVRHIIVREY